MTQRPSTSICNLALLALLAGLWACGSGGERKDRAVAAQVQKCADALSAAGSMPTLARISRLLAGCRQVCPTLPRPLDTPPTTRAQLTQVFQSCGGFCTTSARDAWNQAAPGEEYAAAIRACGAESYGLNADTAPLLSASWLLLLRTYEWLQTHRHHADSSVQDKLAMAGLHTHFSVPLPARLKSHYALPASRAARPNQQALYVTVPPDGLLSLRAAALPVARMRPRELELRPVPGGTFPGKIMLKPAFQYRKRLKMLQDIHPGAPRSGITTMPLVLIDADAPLARLLTAMTALDQSQVVLGVAGQVASAHPIIIERLQIKNSAAPVLRVQENEFVLLGAQELRIPRAQVTQLERALDQLSVDFAPLDKVELVLPADADVTTLAQYLDVVARSKFAIALLRDPAVSEPPIEPPPVTHP